MIRIYLRDGYDGPELLVYHAETVPLPGDVLVLVRTVDGAETRERRRVLGGREWTITQGGGPFQAPGVNPRVVACVVSCVPDPPPKGKVP